MSEQFATLAADTLNGAITSAQLTATVHSAALFPTTGNFRIKIDSEVIKVTAVAGAVFTIVRGVNGTTPAAHNDAATVTCVVTDDQLTNAFVRLDTAGTQTLTGQIAGASVVPFVASGASHAPGAVPDPGASAGTTKFLREDATFATPLPRTTARFRVWAQTAVTSIANDGNPHKVTSLDTVETDPSSWWDATNQRWKPLVAGWYMIYGRGQIATATGGAVTAQGFIKGVLATDGAQAALSATFGVGVSFQDIKHFDGSSDYLEMFMIQSSNANKNTITGQAEVFLGAILMAAD